MSAVKAVESIEAVRKRPGMYIGDVHDGSGLLHMLWEVFGNSVDLFLAGRCTRIDITLEGDGAVTVEDDGPGMRTDMVNGMPFPELAFTTLHRTPTLDGHAPHEHVGLRGVGIGAVSALSSDVCVEIHRDGSKFRQRFSRGCATTKLERLGASERTGTRVTFLPDPDTLRPTSFNAGAIAQRLEELSYLLPDLTTTLHDERRLRFHQPRGLSAWVDGQLRPDGAVRPSQSLAIREVRDDITVEAAANWGRRWTVVESFANVDRTTKGGTHVQGLLLGLTAGLRAVAPQACTDASPRDLEKVLTTGLVAIVRVRLNDLEFAEPTKSKLVTPRVRDIVKVAVAERFCDYLMNEPDFLGRLKDAIARGAV